VFVRGTVIEAPFLSPEECEELISYANRKRAELLENEDLLRLGTYTNISRDQVTTALYNSYSVLRDYPHLGGRLSDLLASLVPTLARPLLIQSWVNVYSKGEGISWHNHAGTDGESFTANIFLGGDPVPGLLVKDFDGQTEKIQNRLGHILFMDCSKFHTVPPNNSDTTRYSVGMTIHSYHALTPGLLQNACLNSFQGSVLLS